MPRSPRCFLCLCEPGPGVELQPGHGAEVCRSCVLRLAALYGWSPPPPEPFGRRTMEDVKAELAELGLDNVEYAGLELAWRAKLVVRGPHRNHDLQEAARRVARALGREHDPDGAVDVLCAPPRYRVPVALETAAGAMYFRVSPLTPRPTVPVLQFSTLVGRLDEYRNYWRRLERGPDRRYGRAVELVLMDDLPGALAFLDQVDPDHPTADDGRLLRALVLVLRGGPRDWREAQAQLTGLSAECRADLRPLVRFDLARLMLARGQASQAAALLDGVQEFEAPRVRRNLTPPLLALGDCRTHLRQIAAALDEYRAAHERLPERLGDLQPGFLNAVPTCPATLQAYRYRPLPDGAFSLRCAGAESHRVAGAAAGHPMWDPCFGAIVHPADRPPLRRGKMKHLPWSPSGPLEALAWRVRTTVPGGSRGALWLSAARESAGDLPAAVAALDGTAASRRPGLYHLHRTLLLIRMEEPREARECLGRCLDHTPFTAAGSPLGLLYRRFHAAYAALRRLEARDGAPLLTGLFLLLCRAGLADRAARLVPPASWLEAEGGERLAYMTRAIRLLQERGGRSRLRQELAVGGNPIRQALVMLYEGRVPQAVLCLEVAVRSMPALETELRLLLARAYREAGERAAALQVLAFEPAPAERLRHGIEMLRVRGGGTFLEVSRFGRDGSLVAEEWADAAEALLDSDDRPTLERMLDLDPAHPRQRLARAAILLKVERRDEARDLLQGLVADHPRWAAAADLLASTLSPEEALAACERALRERPGHVRLRARRARALLDVGREAPLDDLRRDRPDLEDPLTLLDHPGPLDGPGPADLLPPRMAALAEEWPA